MDIKEIQIAKLELQPGDVLLVKVDGILSGDQCERMRDGILAMLPQGVKCLVACKDVDLSIIRRAEAA